jgi:hypothetical protein
MKHSEKFLFITIIFVISVFLNSCSKKEQTQNNVPQPVATVTTQNQTAGDDTANVTLSESKMTKKDVQKKFNEIRKEFDKADEILGNTDIKIGDINGDGKDDALVNYVIVPKDGNIVLRSGVVIYSNDGEKLNFILKYDFPYTAYVDKIKDNLLFCIRTEFRPTDPACCPSVKKPFKMKLEDNKLVLADLK